MEKEKFSFKKFLKILGPGLITGSSDDDPSGIATYSQAGAGFGFATLWTALITFPLMASIQEMCARIGIVTSQGLARTLKLHYPKGILYLMLLFSFPAITLNIGANIQSMGAVAHLLFPVIPAVAFSIFFTAVLIFTIIKYPYLKLVSVMKWLCLSLLLYIFVPFILRPDWKLILKNTFIPTVKFDKDFISILVAILGTTISPYLFFWQTTMEAESLSQQKEKIIVDKKFMNEMKADVYFGMFFSNIVMFFIILTAGAVLFKAGIKQIDTVEQAAQALKPLAGEVSYFLFAIGVIGTGCLSIPVLSGSLSYILAETFNWSEGLDKKFHEAKGFYITIITSLVLGLSLEFLHITPIQSLIYTAILYGVSAPVLIAIILHISNNKKVMGGHTNNVISNFLGFLTLFLMTAAVIALLYLQF